MRRAIGWLTLAAFVVVSGVRSEEPAKRCPVGQLQKLTAEGLEAERRALAAAKGYGDYTTALEILRGYVSALEKSGLPADRISVLKRSIDRRVGEIKTLEARKEPVAILNASETEKKRLEERTLLDHQIAELMKQYHKCYREGKYHEAWLITMRCKDLDPDNLAIQTPVIQADMMLGGRTCGGP